MEMDSVQEAMITEANYAIEAGIHPSRQRVAIARGIHGIRHLITRSDHPAAYRISRRPRSSYYY